MKLENVVPWGRDFDEYVAMFDLSSSDLTKYIVDVAGGPSGFNASMQKKGQHITSIDPLYTFSKEEIQNRIDEVYPTIISELSKNRENYLWDFFHTPEQLGEARIGAMQHFLDDYELGKRQNRYVAGALPELPVENDRFDIALCSHFLFTYSYHFDVEFHVAALLEMMRIAKEVRVFPLLSIDSKEVPFYDEMIARLHKSGFSITIQKVNYQFQKGADEMLIIRG